MNMVTGCIFDADRVASAGVRTMSTPGATAARDGFFLMKLADMA